MKRFLVFALIVFIIFLNAGCKKIRKMQQDLIKAPEEKPLVLPVENVELAEAIVWPKPYHFSLPRDPFKPLVGKLSLGSSEDIELTSEAQIKVVGILIKEGKHLALLEVPMGGGIFKEGDKLGKFTIKKIEPKRVLIEKDNKISIIEIGEEK